jgi:hypothetical protein
VFYQNVSLTLTCKQPRLPHVIERKGNPAPPALLPNVSIMSASDLIPRVWMLSNDGTELIQVQTDRFLRNWRRYHNDTIPYPSYESSGRPGFEEDFKTFCKFVEDQRLGNLEIDQCEMTYINHIRPCGVWSEFAQLDRVFKRSKLAPVPKLSSVSHISRMTLRMRMCLATRKIQSRRNLEIAPFG